MMKGIICDCTGGPTTVIHWTTHPLLVPYRSFDPLLNSSTTFYTAPGTGPVHFQWARSFVPLQLFRRGLLTSWMKMNKPTDTASGHLKKHLQTGWKLRVILSRCLVFFLARERFCFLSSRPTYALAASRSLSWCYQLAFLFSILGFCAARGTHRVRFTWGQNWYYTVTCRAICAFWGFRTD
jgi:hypothetical protein